VLASLLFRTASVGIWAGFSYSFHNVISHGRSTGYEGRIWRFNCGRQSSVRSTTITSGSFHNGLIWQFNWQFNSTLIAKVDNRNINNHNYKNKNNRNRRGEPILVIRVRNNNLTIVMYRKSEHTRESDLKYYERRYYNKLKDDYYSFKISDSIYRCLFCYNNDYSLIDLLRHASWMAGNSHKHFVLITYIQCYLNVEVDKNKPPDVIDSTILSLNPLLFDVEDTAKL